MTLFVWPWFTSSVHIVLVMVATEANAFAMTAYWYRVGKKPLSSGGNIRGNGEPRCPQWIGADRDGIEKGIRSSMQNARSFLITPHLLPTGEHGSLAGRS